MAHAIALGKKGVGRTSPNPAVGAVIVKNGRVIGEGYHKKAGAPHAEIEALSNCKISPKGATLYVTLEPCNHHGKTGPCTEAIISAGITNVIIGAKDRSIKKGVKGTARLKRAGVSVTTGVLKEECNNLVADFHKLSTTGLPFVTVKTAMTLDGKVATRTGDSKWITSETSRRKVHAMRSESDAVMVGIKTVLADDPQLTVRYGKSRRQPIRIIADSRLSIPIKSRLIATLRKAPLIIATTSKAPASKRKKLEKAGVEVLTLPQKKGGINLKTLLKELARRNIMNLLVEGGGALSGALMDEGLVDRVAFFIAPKISGGSYSAMTGNGVLKMADAWSIESPKISMIGPDLLLEGNVARSGAATPARWANALTRR